MFNFLKKNKIKNDDWSGILKSRILPESEYYYSEITTFNREFIREKISKTSSPHMSVDNKLHEGLYLSYAEFDEQVSTAYLQVSLDIANAILALPQSETERWNGEDLYTELYHSSISIDKLLLESLLDNEGIDMDELACFSKALLNYLKTYKGRLWEGVNESKYLSSVWHLMIAGQLKDAKAHLSVRKSFRYTENLYNWTKQLNKLLIEQQSGAEVGAEINTMFDEVFDVIRSPYWKTDRQKEENRFSITMNPNYVRLQLAIIRWLYVEKQPLKGHWNEVLTQVSR